MPAKKKASSSHKGKVKVVFWVKPKKKTAKKTTRKRSK